MPFTGPGDATLPDNVKGLPEAGRTQWVEIFNSAFERCEADEGSDCEASAFRQANGVVFANQLQFVSNQIAKSERRTVDGVEFLVAPGVFVKPGVLNAELVPADEIASHFEAWNGRPFIINHPVVDGVTVSANSPEILAGAQIGRMFNVHLDDGALKGEIWVDVAKAQSVVRGNEVMDRLANGKMLEVSTAYFRDREQTSGTHEGEEFSSITRNLRPDHLAALLDVEGACSWNDGCGAPRVNQQDDIPEVAGEDLLESEQTSNDNLVVRMLKSIQRALNINQEGNMDELVSAVMNMGGLNVSEEDLRGLSLTVLTAIVEMMKAAAKAVPEASQEDDEEHPTEQQLEPATVTNQQAPVATVTNQQVPVTNATQAETVVPAQPEMPAAVLALAEDIEERGGFAKMMEAFDTIQANEAEDKTKLVTALAANAACMFSKEQLGEFTFETLTTLDKSLRPAFYSGQGGGEPVANTREQEYVLPTMFGK